MFSIAHEGAPSSNQLIYRQNFVTSFNSRLRNPDWVLEVITDETCQGLGTRYISKIAIDAKAPGVVDVTLT